MVTKSELHQIVDELAEDEVEAAAHLLGRLREDPLLAVHEAAPVDDEAPTDEEIAGIGEGLADIAAGREVSLDDLRGEIAGRAAID